MLPRRVQFQRVSSTLGHAHLLWSVADNICGKSVSTAEAAPCTSNRHLGEQQKAKAQRNRKRGNDSG